MRSLMKIASCGILTAKLRASELLQTSYDRTMRSNDLDPSTVNRAFDGRGN